MTSDPNDATPMATPMNIYVSKFDMLDQPREAAEDYEHAIQGSDTPIETYLNLLGLYIQCLDGGYIYSHGLDQEFVSNAWEKLNRMIPQLQNNHENNEIDFWEYYKNHLGNRAHDLHRLNNICLKGPSLVPYFLYYSLTRDQTIKSKLNELLEEVKNGRTARERYVKSHMTSSLLHDTMK